MKHEITFVRLPEIDPGEIIVQMSDPRVAEHMPLLTGEWDSVAVTRFVETKEACWDRDGLGARFVTETEYDGARFLKYRLETQ